MTGLLAVRLAVARSACLVARVRGRWRAVGSLGGAFGLSPHERAFARAVLTMHTRLWLYRCNQQRFCGDFIAIDQSRARCGSIPTWAIELKATARVRTGRPGLQLANCQAATRDIASALDLQLRAPTPVIGDDTGVLALL